MAAGADKEFEEYSAAAKAATSFADLKNICIRFFLRQNIQMMSYHHLPPVGAVDRQPSLTVVAFGFPEAWVADYTQKEYYKVDPITRLSLSRTRPFLWSEVRELDKISDEEKMYLYKLSQAVKGDGLAMPLYGPHGRNGYAGLGFGDTSQALSDFEISRLHWATQLGHQRYCELLFKKAPEEIKLSLREREILERVAFGDSSGDIANALAISRNTVDTYMRRLYVKLDVSDRVTAALRGLAIGVVA